jgi:hypothetical protein
MNRIFGFWGFLVSFSAQLFRDKRHRATRENNGSTFIGLFVLIELLPKRIFKYRRFNDNHQKFLLNVKGNRLNIHIYPF